MDQIEIDEAVEQLVSELKQMGLACPKNKARKMIRHLELVIEKNMVMNLTRIVTLRDAVTLHIVDSLVPLLTKDFVPSEGLRFVDIGTGAGFPGIPLAIMTNMQGTLIDSVGKKVTAVNEFIHQLDLESCRALAVRAELLAVDEPRAFDFVCARAVAQSNVLIEYATPLLKYGGQLILEKANPTSEELDNANYAAQVCGLVRVSRETFELPRDLGHREVLIYEKDHDARIKLPRRNGLAKSDPLISHKLK